jgi:hypothetical protein
LQAHREFQVVTPDTLAEFQGQVLVLPSVSILSATENEALETFDERGGRTVITGVTASGLVSSPRIVRISDCPSTAYLGGLQRDFAQGSQKMPEQFLQSLKQNDEILDDAPSTVATNFGRVNGLPHIFVANFGGLIPGKVALPVPASGIRISVPAEAGDSLMYLPFLGGTQTLRGMRRGNRTEFILPPVERGAVAWLLIY